MNPKCKIQLCLNIVILISLQLIGCASYPQKNDYLTCDFLPITVEHKPSKLNPPQTQQLTFDPICTGSDYHGFKNVDALVISGGAADGAFGAGFLSELVIKNRMAVNGNDETPHPCVITGVSTGALMSPFVYLATSLDSQIKSKNYVLTLQKLYSLLDDESLLAPKTSLLQLVRLQQKKSLYSADAIKKEIETRLTDELITDIVHEYKSTARKIFIGITNVNTGNFEIVDLTRLFELVNDSKNQAEKSKNKQCAFTAIRASTSIPVAFEPVAVKDTNEYKLLVDGGVRYPLFLHRQIIQKLKAVAVQEGKVEKSVRVFVVINHLGLTDQFVKNVDFHYLDTKEYLSNNTEIARNQLYLNASNILDQMIKDETVGGFWVDAQSDKQCKKPNGKHFHIPYQNCLSVRGKNKANEEIPWDFQPNLLPVLLD